MPAEDRERAEREGADEGDRGRTDHRGTYRGGASAGEAGGRERTDGTNRLVEGVGRTEVGRRATGGVVERPSAGIEDPLSDRYRRSAVGYLRESDGPVRVAELARHVVARTADKPPDVVSLDEQKRMYTALQRTHLPLLEGTGVVALDPATETVELADE